ncbi:hypothetical protein [Thalassospira sp. UBA1131]|uniref:hypothetical protein n=1 Tax=Thalassospira sp. UBA1131 TaxID=1947672 RepID=UPI0025E01D8B|nr:hypothetical protein [Thalassospira sp. UBA1131]
MYLDVSGMSTAEIAKDVARLFDLVAEERAKLRSGDAASLSDGLTLSGRHAGAADRLAEDAGRAPVETAAKVSVIAIAYQMKAVGSFNRMQVLCDAVGELSPNAEAWLDNCWNGVAGWWS